ncbi:glutathione S-transferase N-terminal domain-containing protein [Frigidibacter sp.]|uniref:glutathione S-transferase N-terminal domain-containing protein n=1 Tax=Frigidibacter sp. TaxID=2586418 RepID=UPI0027376AA8|nr:glutathione S-transferase N-terminal domain-containing protein [Frigidibacter sp.]MDP3339314.1 glutathione S-transferase N-terminal domain-containing protein [Frigidibacter sp.]
MKLYWSPRSPFVRKVMIVLHERGLLDRVELIRAPVQLDGPLNPALMRVNPLGKIPALVCDEGRVILGSPVICAFLGGLGDGPGLVPADPRARLDSLRWEVLGDGLTDILLLWRSLIRNGIAADSPISDSYRGKIPAILSSLEAECAALAAVPFGLGHIAIACALGQLDFRYPHCGWRLAFPALAEWAEDLNRRPSLAATGVQDDGAADTGDVVMPLILQRPAF